jgi:hypothetical protein
MKTHGLPETFWVVTRPSQVSTLDDICFACNFERLMLQTRGGLSEDEIAGIYAEEGEARKAAARLVGDFPVRPQDALTVDVLVHVMVIPKNEEMPARELAEAAVEAVQNAVRRAEKEGHHHRLEDQVNLGMSEVVDLHDQLAVEGS